MGLKRRLPGLVKASFFNFRLHVIFHPISYFLAWLSSISRLSKLIHQQKGLLINDLGTFKFDYNKRLKLFEKVKEAKGLSNEMLYMEFGVSAGTSFTWWMENNKTAETRFHGFDTFEGLPEAWGTFKKGDMASQNYLEIAKRDERVSFHKGLFQDTLPEFVKTNHEALVNAPRRVFHLDADLYSSTLYVLTTLAPYIKPGDIIFFDEYNVPMHEYLAFDEFCRSYYVKYKFLGAVNNFYQACVEIQ